MRRAWYRKIHVHWWLHLIAWVVLAVPIVIFAPFWWLAPLGAVVFELMLAAIALRPRRVTAAPPRGPEGGAGGAGVREPRRPLPIAGSGAAELPTMGSGAAELRI